MAKKKPGVIATASNTAIDALDVIGETMNTLKQSVEATNIAVKSLKLELIADAVKQGEEDGFTRDELLAYLKQR